MVLKTSLTGELLRGSQNDQFVIFVGNFMGIKQCIFLEI